MKVQNTKVAAIISNVFFAGENVYEVKDAKVNSSGVQN